MNEYGKLIAPTTLLFERIVPGTLEHVWEYLVDDEKRGKWFAGGPTHLVPGGKMELHFFNSKLSSTPDPTPEKYIEYGDGHKSEAEVVEFEKPKLLLIKWEDGLVKFELEKYEENKVKLSLTHEKLQNTKEYRVGVLAGWHTHLNILSDILNNLEIKGFWTVHMRLEGEYEAILEK